MQFKVGDRVEVIKPAIGLIDEDKNNLGPGTVTSVVGQEVEVKVDTNDYPWWYHLDKVRPLIPAGATTIEKPYPHEYPKPTPTPSITVGTQVRLTGVVIEPTQVGDPNVWVEVIGGFERNAAVFVGRQHLEVIRQPFKRGEVVYVRDADIPCVIVEDETNNRVLLTEAIEGMRTVYVDASDYERRP